MNSEGLSPGEIARRANETYGSIVGVEAEEWRWLRSVGVKPFGPEGDLPDAHEWLSDALLALVALERAGEGHRAYLALIECDPGALRLLVASAVRLIARDG